MKRVLLNLVVLSIFISGSAQSTSGFKSKQKNPPGSTTLSINYESIRTSGALKSTKPHPGFYLDSKLQMPAISPQEGEDKIIRCKTTNSPIYFEQKLSALKAAESFRPEDRFWEFFKASKEITGLHKPDEQLHIREIQTDELGITHIRAFQCYEGIRIDGGELVLHLDDRKGRFTGRLVPKVKVADISADISEQEAIEITERDLIRNTLWQDLSPEQKSLLNYEGPGSELIIYRREKVSVLCYEIQIRPNLIETWRYFIDAETGAIIHKYNDTKSDGPATASAYDLNGVLRDINTFLQEGSYYLVNAAESMFNPEKGEGVIVTYDAKNTPSDNSIVSSADNTWNNPAAVSFHYGATKTYKYLEETFGRSSINGEGGNITGIVNLASEDGSGFDNAFWSSPVTYFGNGKVAFHNLAGGLDVVAHEIGHGVVENTANLEYQNQPGAINETYADIFGSMVDREDWSIGEDVVKKEYFPSGTMRDMANPHNQGNQYDSYWQPMHVSEMYIGEQDNGGVHINSGIGNHAYYLYATSLSKEKAEQVFYRALTSYLTRKSQFIDFRIAVVQSATDLYGASSMEVAEAKIAFDKVGIFEEEEVDPSEDYSINQGPAYLLSYDTDPFNVFTLYRSSVAGDDFYELTTTLMKSKVSVVDDGSFCVFVSDDSQIRALGLDPENPSEMILSPDAFWDNVAVSKDGNRLACISTEIDTAIYVYDYITQRWAKFHLYNPTTSHSNTDIGGVLYADAIEFDFTGEYVLYDAYNEVPTTTGEPISYWDIGAIRVWDNQSGDFGDGSIEKLFGTLPEGVSVGNPVFSKNSPNIIAFDYLDAYAEEFAILGANLLTGEVGIITMNTRIGYPNFSHTDAKIVYTAYGMEENDIVAEINLQANKIASSGDPIGLINNAIWPVYYATGSRELLLKPSVNFTVDVKSGNAPMDVQFIDLTMNGPTSWEWAFEGGNPSSSREKDPLVTYSTGGVYQVSLTCSNDAGSNTLTKSSYITVSANTAIQESGRKGIQIYPNPFRETLYIDCEEDFCVRVYNLTGHLLLETENVSRIDLGELKSGVYILSVETEGIILREKVIKE